MSTTEGTTETTTNSGTGTSSGSGTEGGNGRSGSGARTRAAEAYEAARERTSAVYGAARERASTAYESARRGVGTVSEKAADGIETNPMAAVVGGLALGAIVAALVPTSRREKEMLGGVGSKITDTARDAARAARDTGRDKLGEIGLSKDAARERISDLVGSTASAAVEVVRARSGKE